MSNQTEQPEIPLKILIAKRRFFIGCIREINTQFNCPGCLCLGCQRVLMLGIFSSKYTCAWLRKYFFISSSSCLSVAWKMIFLDIRENEKSERNIFFLHFLRDTALVL